MKRDQKIRIAIYTQQPFIAQGLAAVLRSQTDLRLAACLDTLASLRDYLKSATPDVLLIYLMTAMSLSDLHEIRSLDSRCRIVLWGQDLEGDFAFQAMQLGVRSILPGDTSIENFLAALRSVQKGALCFERDLLENVLSHKPVALSMRQRQIVSLVAQGRKNKEIAFSMGITEGTVKAYLYKLFKKLGMNDRLDLALFGRKNLFSGPGRPAQFDGGAVAPSVLLIPRRQSSLSAVQ
ncbi:MAG: response regulator transcription factor [Candidatus Sulfopaludibacter sp.]|nr:response regulator transcription factor [Candidatus Sulfopaludibacter sp.]